MQPVTTDLSLAWRNLVRHRRRSIMALVAVSFGIIALLLAGGFIEWIFLDFRESTIRSHLGHLQIARPGYHTAGKADPYAYLLPERIPELEGPGSERRIETVAPRLVLSGLVSHGDATLSFIGEGVSPPEEAALSDALHITSGSNLSADAPRGVIMGEGLARNLGVSVGDRVVLLATTRSGGTNAVEVTVRGLFTTVTKAYDDAAVRLPLSAARELLRTQGSHVWIVLLKDTAQTDAMAAALRSRLPADRFAVVPWHELSDLYNKTERLFTRQVQGMRLIIALIILLSISNTMMMSVMERISEIGTAMALGVRRSGIIRLFLMEGSLLGIVGGLIGLVLGWILAIVISSAGIPMPPPPGMPRGYTGEILITARLALQALLLAAFTTLLASVYPAWRASRMVIVDALRHSR